MKVKVRRIYLLKTHYFQLNLSIKTRFLNAGEVVGRPNCSMILKLFLETWFEFSIIDLKLTRALKAHHVVTKFSIILETEIAHSKINDVSQYMHTICQFFLYNQFFFPQSEFRLQYRNDFCISCAQKQQLFLCVCCTSKLLFIASEEIIAPDLLFFSTALYSSNKQH